MLSVENMQNTQNWIILHIHDFNICLKDIFSFGMTHLTISALWGDSADDKLMTFFYFSQKTGFDISCKLSPVETICMNGQNLFSGEKKKKKKKISKCLLKFLPRVININIHNTKQNCS